MDLHPNAGKLPPQEDLINVAQLTSAYYRYTPSPENPEQKVTFGTSGHRGNALNTTFNELHIASICQALAEYRTAHQVTGPCFIGKDTHALSEPALITAIEVLTANSVNVVVQQDNGFTPTPVISRAIIRHNRTSGNAANGDNCADGIVITPSHNPPTDGGFKYNEVHGGPAAGQTTSWIENRANELMAKGFAHIKRIPIKDALASQFVQQIDFAEAYINDLEQVIDMQAIAGANIRIGTDPLGGAGLSYWKRIAERYSLDITVVNEEIDQRFAFMHCDHDGKIRMDCSSPYAMQGLIQLKDQFDVAFGNDADFDRHGIVVPSVGLLNPNHYLAVAIDYLLKNRPMWGATLNVGKTLVSSSMIDKVVESNEKTLQEMPVGFKWFVEGLQSQQISFAGEESAGGIFLQRDGLPWATDKDGFIMCLLAAEIKAVTDKEPGEHYTELEQRFGKPHYKRVDVAATREQKAKLSQLTADDFKASNVAGEKILDVRHKASGNDAKIGGIKVTTQSGWFAARPSGTEDVYKIYAESFDSEAHLQALLTEAQKVVNDAIS